MNDHNNIFLTYSSADKSNKVTYTSLIQSIPNSKMEKPIKNWKDIYTIEFRWRFMKDSERHIVEISKLNKNNKEKDRLYYNKFGEWVKRDIPEDINKFVVKEYYVYTNE